MLIQTSKKIFHGGDPCPFRVLFTVWRGVLYVLAIISTTIYLSACATAPLLKSAIIPVNQFPEFINSDGSSITPDSIDGSMPDVDILALNDEIKAILDQSVLKIKDPGQRLNALLGIIMKKVKYDTADDKYGTKTAVETFESGTGNCLSYSNLFVAAARYAGLHSGFQDIPIPPNWIKNGEVLFITRHIGAFVDFYIPMQNALRIDFVDGKSVVVSDNKSSFLFAPSVADIMGSQINPLSTRPMPDNRAFAQYYNNIGSQYMAEGITGDAYRYFVKAVKIDPDLEFAWSNLGVVYSRNNQIDAAEKAFSQALLVNRGRNDTSAMTIMSNMARFYAKNGRKEQAAFYKNEVLSFRMRNPYYYFSIGKIAYDDSRFEEAIGDFKEAIQKKEDEHLFYYALALAYTKLGDIKNAEKSFKKAKSYAWDEELKDYYDLVIENLLKKI